MAEHITAEDIARALGDGKEVSIGDGAWNTRCPVHKDNGPSLTVKHGRDGKLLIHCHAGCNSRDVIDALRSRDLWPRKTRIWTPVIPAPEKAPKLNGLLHPRLGAYTRSWEYKDAAGRTVGHIARFDMVKDGKPAKELLPITWCHSDDGKQTWWWKSFDKPRSLYNADKLATSPHLPVLVVEGEKTADEAEKFFGQEYVITTWAGGSKALKYANWEALTGRDVIFWPDADVPGAKAAIQLGEILLTIFAKSYKIVQLPEGLEEAEKGWDLADDIPPGFNFDRKILLLTAKTYESGNKDIIEEYNKEFALILLGDKAVILQEEFNPRKGITTIKYLSTAAFKEYYKNRFVTVGRSEIPAPNYWLSHENRRSYKGVIFEPGVEDPDKYNLWRGFNYEPDPTGDWSLLEEHVRENVASGNESYYHWIMGWFADIIQNPLEKSGTSLCIRGKQGTGKTILGQFVGALFKHHYALVDSDRYVTGQFNSHMASLLLLHADEAFFAGDPRLVGRLKGMVTSPTNRIEHKGKDSFEVENYMRLFISSNERFVIPAALEERRFAVFNCGEGRIQDRPYFKRMIQQMKEGGFEGFLHYLQTYDLSNFDVGVIPNTDALVEQKYQALGTIPRFWFERLQDGEILPGRSEGWPTAVGSEELYQAYLARAHGWGERRRATDSEFFRDLKVFVPDDIFAKRKTTINSIDSRGNTYPVKGWGYQLPTLERCRLYFDETLGGKFDWHDVASDNEPGEEPRLNGDHGDDDIPF